MLKISSLILTLMLSISLQAQEKFTISGTIQSGATGETLIGVTVRAAGKGTSSNEYGFSLLLWQKAVMILK